MNLPLQPNRRKHRVARTRLVALFASLGLCLGPVANAAMPMAKAAKKGDVSAVARELASGTDPNEANDLSSDPAHAKTLAKYQDLLKKFQKDFKDPWIMKWDYE